MVKDEQLDKEGDNALVRREDAAKLRTAAQPLERLTHHDAREDQRGCDEID
jgi:hypothetical protein